MKLSSDSQTILLLCSHIGLPPNPDSKPLKLSEWNRLARKLQSISSRPGILFSWNEDQLKNQLGLPDNETIRIMHLLERRGSLAIELERLNSLGIRAMTRADEEYPLRYRQRLKDSAPVILFYAGNNELLGQSGIAVVGSRNLDNAGQESAALIGNACFWSGMVLYSGGAKGVDTISMNAALEARGTAVCVLAHSLDREIRIPEARAALLRGDLCLVTPYAPSAGFSVGAAMGRNKLIYCLADYAIVVASEYEKGGTWAGAVEALKADWIPVFVLDHPEMPVGNRMLIQKEGLSLPYPFPVESKQLLGWLEAQASSKKTKPKQLGLF